MKRYILVLLVMVTLGNVTFADDNTAIHFAAHAGTSNGITLLGDQVLEKAFGFDKQSSMIFSSIGSLLIGASYCFIKNSGSASMLYNGIGTAAGGIQIWSFDL